MADYLEGKAVGKLIDGLKVTSAEMAIVNDTQDVFNIVGGLVYVHSIVGKVVTTCATSALRLRINPDGAAESNLCADRANIDGDEAGVTFYTLTGTTANVLQASTQLLAPQAAGFILPAGVIEQVTDAASAGGIVWEIFYTPIDEGAYIEPA